MKLPTPHPKPKGPLCLTLLLRVLIRFVGSIVLDRTVTGQLVEPDHTVLTCIPTTPAVSCAGCDGPRGPVATPCQEVGARALRLETNDPGSAGAPLPLPGLPPVWRLFKKGVDEGSESAGVE